MVGFIGDNILTTLILDRFARAEETSVYSEEVQGELTIRLKELSLVI
jgi:hypothetical protein